MQTTIEQEAPLRIPLANVPMPQSMPPARPVIQPQPQVHQQSAPQPVYLPSAQTVAPSSTQVAPYASAAAAHASHMIPSTSPRKANQLAQVWRDPLHAKWPQLHRAPV